MQEKDDRNDMEQTGEQPAGPPERAVAAEQGASQRPAGHGTSSIARIMTLGAFAARDQVPPEKPGAIRGRPRWPERFGHLVSAFEAERQGNNDDFLRYLEQAGIKPPSDEANVGDAVAFTLGGDEPDEQLFKELFGWSGVSVDTYISLPFKFKPTWIIQILCCALGYRRNTFGRYFSAVAAGALPQEADLLALSELMNEAFESAAGDSNIPAGFIFFGQFLDHDITLDTSSRLTDVDVDPTTILNVRSPALDLDNVYADGPEGSPELYHRDRGHGFLLVSQNGKDLARNHLDVAIIGDPRNDENTIVSQLHLHFLHFHNGVLRMIKNTPVDALWGRHAADEPNDDAGDFEFARRMVRWHYQWVVVNDYLSRIIEPATLQAAHAITGVPQGTVVPGLPAGFEDARDFFDSLTYIDCCGSITCRPLMPVEFSAAAFRFAHSQVRSRYDLNAARLDVPLFEPRPPGMASFMPVPNTDLVEWERFFELEMSITPQPARQIDTWLPAQVFQLPFAPDEPNLAFRNLRRGARVYALPTGADVAANLGLILVMGPVALGKLATAGIPAAEAPLWFAILGEAESNGGQLGPVGGLLVAVTLFRLLQCDESSYVHEPGWEPVLLSADPGQFSAADLLRIGTNERMDAFPS
jgi:hypothetical protein